MSPTTPQSKFFQAPQEFDDPLQMVEWLILLDFKLQPERLVVGDYLHVRRTLRDLQVDIHLFVCLCFCLHLLSMYSLIVCVCLYVCCLFIVS